MRNYIPFTIYTHFYLFLIVDFGMRTVDCGIWSAWCDLGWRDVLMSFLPTPRPLGGGNQNRLPACTIFSLWLYILFLPNMLLWRYIFRQAGAQLRVGGGAWAFFFGSAGVRCGGGREMWSAGVRCGGERSEAADVGGRLATGVGFVR